MTEAISHDPAHLEYVLMNKTSEESQGTESVKISTCDEQIGERHKGSPPVENCEWANKEQREEDIQNL